MSTPNPTHIDIIARGLALASDDACFDREPDDDSPSDAEDREYWMKLARASVSKLTDAGYSIMPNVVLAELIDSDKCSFDHNGGCQAHGHFPPDDQAWTCPVEDAKNILAAATEEGQ